LAFFEGANITADKSMETKKHYVVTGGAGFIGSHVVRKLLERKDVQITCIDSFDPFYRRQLKLLNIEGFEKHHNFFLRDIDLDNVTVTELHQAIPQPVDVVVHLAAKAGVRPSITHPMAYQHTNILGTQKMLEFAVEKKVPQFVFASSSSVYGENEKAPWTEDETPLPISPYAMTKQSGEMAGHVYQKLFGLRFIALRFFTVYGPGQRPDLAIHKFTKALMKGEPLTVFGDGSTSRDYTYVDDIVQGVVAAIDYTGSPFEIINLGNNYAVPLKDLIAQLETVTGKKAQIEQQPEQPGDLRQTCADVSKAQRLLNYQPQTKLEDGLRRFHDWYKKHEAILNMD
jgi:UDP-glucuronate 4-epimerase